MQYCGYAVWNVHTKAGRKRPPKEWVITERAHEALITEDEARRIVEARWSLGGKKQFNAGATRSRAAPGDGPEVGFHAVFGGGDW